MDPTEAHLLASREARGRCRVAKIVGVEAAKSADLKKVQGRYFLVGSTMEGTIQKNRDLISEITSATRASIG